MITLYHSPKSRSARMIWLLEELGAPYEIKTVTVRRADGTGAVDPANPHPHGKVPAIKDSDDGTVVFESPAIALYLTDKFPKNGIGPEVGDAKRGTYLSWLSYYTGVLEPAFLSKFLNTPVPRGTAGWVVVEEAARAWPTELALPLVRGLRWTLIGDHFQLPAFDELSVHRFLDLCGQTDDEELQLHGARTKGTAGSPFIA